MKTKAIKFVTLLFASILIGHFSSPACTNFLVTNGASTDGSTMITYAADSHVLYGELYYWPAADHPAGTMMDIHEWDTGKLLGEIPQVRHTYRVVGNMNQHQVSIGETTYGGREEVGVKDTNAIMDYGSLMYVTLQRARNAREAIKVMTTLVDKYGYYSTGESFSISDPNEVWILEMIGKGPEDKGAVWVARKIPDGYVSAHANQARIRTFPLADQEESIQFSNIDKIFNEEVTTVYADDVISFAKEKGFYEGKNEDFSFSDTYAPMTFGGARFCEARVWSFFRDVHDNMDQYLDYARGHDLDNRMPLWIKPNRKISARDMMNFMRDHYEDTELDMRKDFGAGPFDRPYRWRPLTWKVEGETFCNERATATQQTGFSFVAQARDWLPDPVGGIIWFSVDDAASTVYTPLYAGLQKAPATYKEGNGSMMSWSDNSAFWIFNQVSNLAYSRYDLIHPYVHDLQQELEKRFVQYTQMIDGQAEELYKEDQDKAVKLVSDFSVDNANTLVHKWERFYRFLFMKFMDGNVKLTNGRDFQSNGTGVVKLKQPGYSKDWYKKLIEETGDKFKVPEDDSH
ncbi:MAG: C69 family dipeptidase [Bacteroidales bacterium]|nr:C69 family dipeptidase [Bacteroidales bacterium]